MTRFTNSPSNLFWLHSTTCLPVLRNEALLQHLLLPTLPAWPPASYISAIGCGAIGAGVRRPVHPKSQMQRSATANPNTDGTAPSHRHPTVLALSTRKPSHPGNSQNQRAKNAAPTASAAAAVSHCSMDGPADCERAMKAPT